MKRILWIGWAVYVAACWADVITTAVGLQGYGIFEEAYPPVVWMLEHGVSWMFLYLFKLFAQPMIMWLFVRYALWRRKDCPFFTQICAVLTWLYAIGQGYVSAHNLWLLILADIGGYI